MMSNVSMSQLTVPKPPEPRLPPCQLYLGVRVNETMPKNVFNFTSFHGPSAARPYGWRLLTRSGKVRVIDLGSFGGQILQYMCI